MPFEWALQQMREGRKVMRLSWKCGWSRFQQSMWYEEYLGKPVLRTLFSQDLRAEDLEAQDWVVKEPQEERKDKTDA